MQTQLGRNGIYVVLRLATIAAMSLVMVILQPLPLNTITFATIQHLVVPIAIGLLGVALVTIFASIKDLQVYAPIFILGGDWLLIAAYTYYILSYTVPSGGISTAFAGQQLVLLGGLMSVMIASGILRLGQSLGLMHLGGTFVISIGAFAILPTLAINQLGVLMVPFVISALIAAITYLWYGLLDGATNTRSVRLRQENEAYRRRLDDMRSRMGSLADMAATLNATLNYDKILNATMDIGRLSIRGNPKERLISMALMVEADGSLGIATARGIPHNDNHHSFEAKYGILEETLREGRPMVRYDGENDPELSKMIAFKNIRSTLVIPLRAGYENYGLLVFGSTQDQAINEDHIDTLAAIGTQATIALRNAVLYSDLMEEKERIIRIEENGRKALVRDLHDIPTQTISAVAMQLSIIPMIAERSPERLEEEVTGIRDMALRATEEIRHVMFTLRPLSLESQGLIAALDQLADKMEQTYGQPMVVQVQPQVQEALSQEAQGTIFYLIEEAANNARKYAEASVVRVRAQIEGEYVMVYVEDNGKGFDMGSVSSNYEERGSFGMVNMRERAELVGGEFNLRSAINKGTTITVRIPVEPDYLPDARMQPRKSLRRQYSGPLSPSR